MRTPQEHSVLDGVQPGSYEITVEHEGLKSATARVRVGARPPPPLVIRLGMAEVRSAVTVDAQATQVSTNAADNSNTVTLTRQSLDDLPIFDQDYIGTMSRFLDAGSSRRAGSPSSWTEWRQPAPASPHRRFRK